VAAKDVFHDAVRHALEKEQWIITDDPLFLRFGGVDMYIDLAAEQLMSAERNGEKIAVEIKSFIGVSATTEFSTALEEEQPDRVLYLAIPLDAYRSFFTLELPRRLVERYRVNLIVYEPEEEEIVRWQK
jgi:hypothetical protein